MRVASALRMAPAAAAAWRQHLTDDEVEPRFEQLREPYRCPETERAGTDITAFEGHMIDAFALRTSAAKLHYQRGPYEGGWFTTYCRHFPGLELETVIEFTGSLVPMKSEQVALRGVSFQRKGKLSLEQVPPVLLSEAYNDVKEIAEAGLGFDPEWDAKTDG